ITMMLTAVMLLDATPHPRDLHSFPTRRSSDLMSRRQLEKSGYLKSFPNLLGCVCALHGTEAEIRRAADRHEAGGDWTASLAAAEDRKSTRLNSSHLVISYAVFCLKKKKKHILT